MESQLAKVIVIRHWLILGALSILSSSSVFAPPVWAQTKHIDFTLSSKSNQTAETREIDFTLSSESNQTFSALMEQAEFLATSFIKQEFAENPSTTKISVSILGFRNGQEAPLLFSKVSRSDWQRQPRIQQWTRYFSSSAVLLGFNKPQIQQSTSAPSPVISTQQSTSTPSRVISTQQSTSTPSPVISTQQSTSAPSRSTFNPTGVSLEEGDPGFR